MFVYSSCYFFVERRSTSDTKEEAVQEKPKSMLDNLFRKTKATPAIYWLPLSEKEVRVLFPLLD